MRPENLLALADQGTPSIPAGDPLRTMAEVGVQHRRLPRLAGAERASSGRAHCRSCRELIAKGDFRIRLQMFEEGRMTPIGTIHAECAEPYFGTRDVLERIALLTPDLTESDLAEIARKVASPPPSADAADAAGTPAKGDDDAPE
jgi:hypothetical protein